MTFSKKQRKASRMIMACRKKFATPYSDFIIPIHPERQKGKVAMTPQARKSALRKMVKTMFDKVGQNGPAASA